MKRVRYTGDPSVRVGSKLIERGGEVDVDMTLPLGQRELGDGRADRRPGRRPAAGRRLGGGERGGDGV